MRNAEAAGDLRPAIAAMFDRSAETYDAVGVEFFALFARRLLADIGLRPGERVLDAGCGRGAVLFPAADQVGAAGSVLGIDLSPGMVERTAQEIRGRGLANAAAEVMDAQEPSLPPASFDVVLASCVVFFLPDPLAGLRAWRALLAPGGRAGVTTFCGSDPRWSGVQQVFRPFVPPAMIRAMTDPSGPFASTAHFERTLESAGFATATSVVRRHDIVFAGPEQCIAWSQSHGQRVFWELVPDERRAAVRDDVLAALEPLREHDGSLVTAQTVRYTVAS